jgi:hypothetical protein
MELTPAATATTTTTVDDPIKRMIWSLGPDSKTRYPKRFKMVLDFLRLTKPEDEDYEALWNKGIRITPAKRHEFKGCHGFRKYCKTYAQRTMSSEYVEKLLGHAGNWSDAAYNRPLEDWLVEAYLKAVTDLTIYKPSEVVEQTQELTVQMASKDKEIQALKDNVKSMQEDMQDIFEVLRVVKRNGGRVGTDKTVLDENRNITFYQDYENAHGLRQTVGVKIPIDAVEVEEFQSTRP